MRLPGALLAGLLALSACQRSAPKPGSSPGPATPKAAAGNGWNVLLLTIDTLRADHLGAYGYPRATSRRMDALAAEGTLFEQAYTYWPKTRGSFVMIHTGRRPSQNGYSKTHQSLLGFNATLASTLQDAGYRTAAVVDNPNVSGALGYSKGFEAYRETWTEKDLADEVARTEAITSAGIDFLKAAPKAAPFFLWLHWVNPHAPYTPPPPHDTAFLEAKDSGPRLAVVPGFHGGIKKEWAVPGRDRLGYYVAQYDGEIAYADAQVGRVLDALAAAGLAGRTVVVLTSDHGESLGEHGYFFDHGEDVFDPSLRIPLLVRAPGASPRRTAALASTLDLLPTVLDAVKVSYPPDLAGRSLLGEVEGRPVGAPERLFAGNDRNLGAAFDARHKLVAVPKDDGGAALSLYDRRGDPGEVRDLARQRPDELRVWRRELELQQERAEREWERTRGLVGDKKKIKLPPDACERLKALGYVGVAGCEEMP